MLLCDERNYGEFLVCANVRFAGKCIPVNAGKLRSIPSMTNLVYIRIYADFRHGNSDVLTAIRESCRRIEQLDVTAHNFMSKRAINLLTNWSALKRLRLITPYFTLTQPEICEIPSLIDLTVYIENRDGFVEDVVEECHTLFDLATQNRFSMCAIVPLLRSSRDFRQWKKATLQLKERFPGLEFTTPVSTLLAAPSRFGVHGGVRYVKYVKIKMTTSNNDQIELYERLHICKACHAPRDYELIQSRE